MLDEGKVASICLKEVATAITMHLQVPVALAMEVLRVDLAKVVFGSP